MMPAFAGGKTPAHLGVFLTDEKGAFYEVVKVREAEETSGLWIPGARSGSRERFLIKPASLSSKVSMPSGMTVYPLKLTAGRDGIPERDPVSGEEFGPAGLVSEWRQDRREFSARYTNGRTNRNFLRMKAPEVLPAIEDAITDRFGNVFWISSGIDGSLRIHHQNAWNDRVPLNEIAVREKIRKVRGNPSGDGISALLEDGQLLDIRVEEDFSLHVLRVNHPAKFIVVDFESGPVGGDAHSFSLVMFGVNAVSGKAELRVKEGIQGAALKPVEMKYVDYFKREIEVPFIQAIYGNAHFTELGALLDRHPGELNKFLQYQYEVRQEEIQLLLHRSGNGNIHPADDRNLIGRKVVIDHRVPGMCRYYLLSNFGLSPDVFLN